MIYRSFDYHDELESRPGIEPELKQDVLERIACQPEDADLVYRAWLHYYAVEEPSKGKPQRIHDLDGITTSWRVIKLEELEKQLGMPRRALRAIASALLFVAFIVAAGVLVYLLVTSDLSNALTTALAPIVIALYNFFKQLSDKNVSRLARKRAVLATAKDLDDVIVMPVSQRDLFLYREITPSDSSEWHEEEAHNESLSEHYVNIAYDYERFHAALNKRTLWDEGLPDRFSRESTEFLYLSHNGTGFLPSHECVVPIKTIEDRYQEVNAYELLKLLWCASRKEDSRFAQFHQQITEQLRHREHTGISNYILVNEVLDGTKAMDIGIIEGSYTALTMRLRNGMFLISRIQSHEDQTNTGEI